MCESTAGLRAIGLNVQADSVPTLLFQRHERRGTDSLVAPTVEVAPVKHLIASTTNGNGVRKTNASAPAVSEPSVPLRAGSCGFSVVSYNVLLPNSADGWWIYKYYREVGDHTCWPARQGLLRQQLLGMDPDIICLQEASELAFTDDFAFLVDAGYAALLHEKKGRMRPATFWRSSSFDLVSAQHKDRTLVVRLQPRGTGEAFYVVNVHLSAGQTADRRLRQMTEALDAVSKDARSRKEEPSKVPTVVCGDFNSQGSTGVRELLMSGEVGPEFREHGDPTEKGEPKQVTSKTKRQAIGNFKDSAHEAFGEAAPATILAANIDSKMIHDDGTPTTDLLSVVERAFESCSHQGLMTREDVDRWLLLVNKEIGRGSEYRAAVAAFERRGEETLDLEAFTQIYTQELAEGKFWGVEHDLRAMLGSGMAVPAEGPCELRFDYIYFTSSSLRLEGALQPLAQERRRGIWAAPWDVLPNAWHPSDHLPVGASFAFS